jgi:hypothetical protein
VILNEKEQNCIRFLAKCFSENKDFIQRDWAIEHMRVDDVTYETLIKKMEYIGAIENVISVMDKRGYGDSFRISAHAEELARQLDLEEQRTKASPDVVEQLKARAQRNPLTAWLIIIFLILALLVPLLNSLWELLEKIISLGK